MHTLSTLLDFFIHLDKHLGVVIQTYGTSSYAILFLIIFCETGLVVTPFLPGDSLLFAAGAFAASEALDIKTLLLVLLSAAFLGDNFNYFIGHLIGPKVFQKTDSKIFRREHLDRTHRFYERYGGKTIILARFVPIVRTFAPFLAGVGAMTYRKFIVYEIAGVILWINLLTLGGYFFSGIPVVKNNFSLVILAIIVLSIMPAVFEFTRALRESKVEK